MSKRPEHVTCILKNEKGSKDSWCGRPVSTEFHFVSIDHATFTAFRNERLLVCPECSEMVINILDEGTFS